MIRVNRAELTRNEIIRLATNRFLEIGYTQTSIHAMSKTLNMSTGNLTFHFPTKEHLLAELVDMLCDFQWKAMEEEAKDGFEPIMGICLELLTMASACEQDEVARDFFISAYTSPMSLDIIRKNDKARAMKVFAEYCRDWDEERFALAETLVTGIEYATLMTTSDFATLEQRIYGALHLILGIYQVPEEARRAKIEQALDLDYRSLGLRVLAQFREYVDQTTEQALLDLLKRKEAREYTK